MQMQYPQYKFPRPHQYRTLSAGETATIYNLNIPKSCTGFIERVGSNWYEDCYFYWYIDGQDVEGRIERQMGSVSSPIEYNPPIAPVVRNIQFTAYNGTDTSLIFEILCDGLILWRPSQR